MQLYSLTLKGFRRFADTWANLEDNVIALVGPNEAGKSSVLAALQALEDDAPIPVTSRTRGRSVPEAQEVITARFRLDRDDLGEPPYPFPEAAAKWLIVAKTAGGPRHFRFDPTPARPLVTRRAGKAALDTIHADAAALSHLPKPLRPWPQLFAGCWTPTTRRCQATPKRSSPSSWRS